MNDLQCYLPIIEYPSTTITFDMSQDLVCSSTTIDIDADNVNAYENL